jgi:outer membrane murein-binding lipoprotein Lpp
MTLEAKIDEILSEVRILGTKIKFLEDDLAETRQTLENFIFEYRDSIDDKKKEEGKAKWKVERM